MAYRSQGHQNLYCLLGIDLYIPYKKKKLPPQTLFDNINILHFEYI